MVPTLCRTPGVKGHRPVVGTRDDKDLLHVFAAADCVSGRLRTRTLASRAKDLRAARRRGDAARKRVSKTRRMTRAFAGHLRDVARAYPARRHRRVVLVIDNAPWHRGEPVRAALAAFGHLELYRLPPYSPQLNPIERLWKALRQRSTHNRLFDTLGDLAKSVRNGLAHFRSDGRRIISLLGKKLGKRTNITGL